MIAHCDVLIVDDDEATRILLETLLRRAGLSVVMASDGNQAKHLLSHWSVDAILLDLFMPRANGTDFLDMLLREKPAMLNRTIVLSAAPEAALSAVVEKYDVFCAMRKPADISDLMEDVLDCLLQTDGGERRPPRPGRRPALRSPSTAG